MAVLESRLHIPYNDEVVYEKLGGCCTLTKGSTPIQKALPGEYPLVVTSATRKTSNTYQFDRATVCIPLISSRGHGVACLSQLFYQEGRFALGNILCGVTPKNEDRLLAKFLFYYLNFKKDSLIVPLMRGGANVSLSIDALSTVRVPIPPMEIQREIVNVLEQFDEFNDSLGAEIEARRRQYEFYRNKILSLSNNVPVFKVQNICINISSGGTPNSKKAEYYDGDIPWLRTQEVDFGPIYDTGVKITEEGLKNSSAKWIPAHCVIVAMYGATVGKVAYNSIPMTTNQACCNLEIDASKALYKYVFYWISNQYRYIKSLGQGSQTNINAKIVKELEIQLPSIPEQQRIVDLLDTIHLFCCSADSDITAELNARKQQFDFYRRELLAFKERK